MPAGAYSVASSENPILLTLVSNVKDIQISALTVSLCETITAQAVAENYQ